MASPLRLYVKPEPKDVQGLCCLCNKNKQMKKGKTFVTLCQGCYREAKGHNRNHRPHKKPYDKFKKTFCESCGFIALHSCQLDVDHIDGNHANNDIINLQTLCANCHRLKSQLNGDNYNIKDRGL